MGILRATLSPEFLSDIPSDPRERGAWFIRVYENIANSHIDHLKRFKILPERTQGLSFTGVIRDEYIKIQYGALLIEFPYAIKSLKQSEWIRMFDIVVDNQCINLDTGIVSVPEVIEDTSTSASRLIKKLLPPRVKTTTIPTSSTCIPRRTIRIQLKQS